MIDTFKKEFINYLDQNGLKWHLYSRKEEVITLRHIYCYLARRRGFIFRVIGESINKDHSNMINSYKKIKIALEIKDPFLMKYKHIIDYFEQPNE